LDGDEIRQHLSAGLGFSRADRSANVRRIGYVAGLLVRAGGIVLCANIAPYEEDRQWNREFIGQHGRYVEVYVNTTLDVCEERDVKGLYAKARSGVIEKFTGISDPFEEPQSADLVIDGNRPMLECLEELEKMAFLRC
jgi:sulfate adenylyltransferase